MKSTMDKPAGKITNETKTFNAENLIWYGWH